MPINWDQVVANDKASMQQFQNRATTASQKYLTPEYVAKMSTDNGGDERRTVQDMTNVILDSAGAGSTGKFRQWVTQLAPVLRIQQKLAALGGGGPVGHVSQGYEYKDFPSFLTNWLGQNPSGMASGGAAHDMFQRALGNVGAYTQAQGATADGTGNMNGFSPDMQAMMSTLDPSDLQAFLGFAMQAQSPYLFSKLGSQMAGKYSTFDALTHGAGGLGDWLKFYDQLKGEGFAG